MNIELQGIFKRYTSSWVLKDVSLSIKQGDRLAVKGNNGSGKSTLIQLIAGVLPPSKGTISYHNDDSEVKKDDIFNFLSIHTAYTELDEELTASELFEHFTRYNKSQITDNQEFMEFAALDKQKNRLIKAYSSGMKQRLALALVFNSKRPLLILDEPGSFLDDQWKSWMADTLEALDSTKTVIIASNEISDTRICNREYLL